MPPRTATRVPCTGRQSPEWIGANPRFRRDVLTGLRKPRKGIPSRWLYDARGSELFREIMSLDAYYPTRVEREILDRHAAEIVAPLSGHACTVVDLGAGDGSKTRLLLAPLRGRVARPTYAPVDISAAALADVSGRMASAFPWLKVRAIQAEYVEGMRALGPRESGPVLVLFLGSNIGNLELVEAYRFLGMLRRSLRTGDHLLVGLDLLKDERTLRAAYDDDQGVTAAFNLNLLTRINRELAGDFDPESFEHVVTFDPARPAMESWLRSRRRQRVRVADRWFRFEVDERIHTEVSCKYREQDLDALAARSGFEPAGRYADRRRWFVDALWRVGEP